MHVLIAEDEPVMADLLRSVLSDEGHHVQLAARGDDGLQLAQTGRYDLLVLDLMLPVLDGFEVLKRLRAARVQTPVLVLTARDTNADIVRALDAGADDYLVKPFSLAVFQARVRAVSRRGSIPQSVVLQAGPVRMDTASRQVTRDGEAIALTPREYALLEVLLRNKGRVLARSSIVDAVWGFGAEVEDNTIEAFIRLLRQKIEVSGKPKLIRTVRGIGYCLGEELA